MPFFDLFTGSKRDQERSRQSRSGGSVAGAGQERFDEEAQYSRELFRKYDAAQESWAESSHENWEFRHGQQWKQEEIRALESQGRAALVIPVLSSVVEQAVAMMTDRDPGFTTTAREDSDVKKAKLMGDLLAYEWKESDGTMRLKQVVDDYYTTGRGVMHVWFDPEASFGTGEVRVHDLDPFEVYPDPHSKDKLWRDAAHILIRRILTAEQIQNLWPDKAWVVDEAPHASDARIRDTRGATDGLQFRTDIDSENFHRFDVIERQSKVRVPYYRIELPEDGQNRSKDLVFDEQDYAAFLEEVAFVVTEEVPTPPQGNMQTGAPIQQQEAPTVSRIVTPYHDEYEQTLEFLDTYGEDALLPRGVAPDGSVIMTRTTVTPIQHKVLMEQGMIVADVFYRTNIKVVVTVGDVVIYNYLLPIEHYTIIPFLNHWLRNPYAFGDVHHVKGLQEEINHHQSIITAHASSSAGTKIFLEEGAVIGEESLEERWSRPGDQVSMLRPGAPPPVGFQPIPLAGEFYANQDRLKQYIYDALGVYPFAQGNVANAPDTFRGTLQMDEFGLRRIKGKLDDIYASLGQVAKVMMAMTQVFMTERKVIRIVEPSGDERMTEINVPMVDSYGNVVGYADDITVGQYDAIVVAGSTMPSNRYALLDYMLQFYDRGIVDEIEILKKSEIFDREGVMERKSLVAQMQSRIAGLEDQLKKLSGDLETAENELRHAKRQQYTEKVKVEAERQKANIRSMAQIQRERIQQEASADRDLLAMIDQM